MSNFLRIGEEKLNTEEILAQVGSEDCGAISAFIGTTRNTMGDKKVARLEYESYDAMALKEMTKICEHMRLTWKGIRHIAIVHRVGCVAVKEASIVIAVSAPHRRDSLEAVSYCIDQVKTTVPIWKKEWYEDSSYVWKENCECTQHRNKLI
jgi:molybdopterin synthase catalytic subunit